LAPGAIPFSVISSQIADSVSLFRHLATTGEKASPGGGLTEMILDVAFGIVLGAWLVGYYEPSTTMKVCLFLSGGAEVLFTAIRANRRDA
jgi:hypothetical protein